MKILGDVLTRTAGVSDIVFSVPRLYVPLADINDPKKQTEFSKSRGVDPAKYIYGIGVAKMSIPDTYQDPVTLAANAIDKLMQRNELNPKNINRIEIGTESSPDKSKSITTYVIGALEKKYGKGSFKRCAAPEIKSACGSTSFGSENALDYIWAGRGNGSKRIVCATDVARYGMKTGAEPTQGAAAAAILFEAEPKLLEFDKVISHFTKNEKTFYRPNKMDEAIVEKESVKEYLNGMKEAFDYYKEIALERGIIKLSPNEVLTDKFDLISFHQPFPKMVENGFAHLLSHENRELDKWDAIIKEIGAEPKKNDFSNENEYEEKEKTFLKKFKKTDMFKKEFNEKVAGGRKFSIESGNSYTVSAWGHLVSLLMSKENDDLTGKRGAIGFFGSGCTASGQSYKVVPGYQEVVKSFNMTNELENRIPVSLQDYEDLHTPPGKLRKALRKLFKSSKLHGKRECVLPPQNEFVLTGIENGFRHYDYAE